MKSYTLGELAAELGAELSSENHANINLQQVVDSSNSAQQGALFVAYEGVNSDGHQFIDQAFEKGCSAVVVSKSETLSDRPGIIVEDGRVALSQLAYIFSDRAADNFLTIGITGTNGKTTIQWLLYHALNNLDKKCLRVGTLGYSAPGLGESTSMVTTPTALETHRLLEKARVCGVDTCVIETSSHALDQHRVDHLRYRVGVFTHLTPDHLHYHGDMDSYFAAKLKLFEFLERDLSEITGPGGAVLNADCEYGDRLATWLQERSIPFVSFGKSRGVNVRIVEFRQTPRQAHVVLAIGSDTITIQSVFIGEHNADNVATAAATLKILGYSTADIQSALSDIPSVPGRLEFFGSESKAVYVDYAHTGDAMGHALRTLRDVTAGKLWVLFGAGGGKDPMKRKLMGEAAQKYADNIVLTADNPKDEEIGEIIDEISQYCKPHFVEHDRSRAIEKALRDLREGDTLLIAGKGHEDYQIIAGKTFHFSDREEVEKFRQAGVF